MYRKMKGFSETQRFLLLSVLIGVFAGLLIVCFHIAMEALKWLTVEGAAENQSWIRVLVPAAGGLIAVVLVARFFREAEGSGINDTKAAYYISDGYVPFRAVIGKFLACTISIGSGNSLGPEDPSLHMGAGIASALGRALGLGKRHMRLIAPVGAAAGIAAAFNTPITAVLFVIEEVVAAWGAAILGSIVLSSVSAVIVVRWFLGDQPLFLTPHFRLTHISELLIYAAMGVIGGVLSALFVKAAHWLKQRRVRSAASQYLRPLGAGLAVGIAGIWLPQVMGAGYGSIDSAMRNQFPWNMLMALALTKIAVTLFCFSAGTPGGMFAPALFTGAMLGGGLGGLSATYWPFPVGAPSAYVLVGMGTFFAGVFRAPMTSIFMIFEVSASYEIILPVMIANTIAYLASRRLQREPFFAMIARHEGLHLPSLEEQRDTIALRVEDAMSNPPRQVACDECSLTTALEQAGNSGPILVMKRSGEWSCIQRSSVLSAIEEGQGADRIRDVFELPDLPRLFPDLTLDAALQLLGGFPVLPVLRRAEPFDLIGTLSLADVHRAYGIERQVCDGRPQQKRSSRGGAAS